MKAISLQSRLEKGEVILLDGGIGTEIKRRGATGGLAFFTGNALLDYPEVVRAVYEDYIRAGADVVTTNTYSTSPHGLKREGFEEEQCAEMNRIAVDLAKEARDKAAEGRQVYMAGAMGPLEKSYRPDLALPYEKALANYQAQAQALANAGVDLILLETMSKISEARAGAKAALETGLPTWVAFVAGSDGRLISQETMEEVVEALEPMGASAILINCTPPEHTTLALRELAKKHSVPIGAYSQAGRYVGPGWDYAPGISPQMYLQHAREWLSLGAQIVGGCCATTPDHIKELKAHLLAPVSG